MWLDRAEEDLYVLSMLDVTRAPNSAAVQCQQALEKCLKACWIELEKRVPYTHDLLDLWLEIETEVRVEISEAGLRRLTPYGTTARYPFGQVSADEALEAVVFCVESCAKLKTWLEARA